MNPAQLFVQPPDLRALGQCSGELASGEDATFSLVCLRWTWQGLSCRSDCPYSTVE
jgi:hypothetical protein